MRGAIAAGGAIAIAIAVSGVMACNADAAWRAPRTPADLTARRGPVDGGPGGRGAGSAASADGAEAGAGAGAAADGGDVAGAASDKPGRPRRGDGSPTVADPVFGTESVKPGDPHAFRLAVALTAARATRSGANVLKMFSVMPNVIDMKKKTGVDPFAEGEWLLVYGSRVQVPGPNANVVKHARSEAEVTRAMSTAGITADGHVQLFGVRDTLVRPQMGVLALVPNDRATEIAAALSNPIDTGLKGGELARFFVGEPSKVASFLPADVVRAHVLVKRASDGGLDASASADCPDAASCAAHATALDETVKRQNSVMVRIALGNLLGSFAVKANGTKLEATLHASPEQVDSAVQLVRAMLGLPAADPSDQKH